MSLLRVKEPDVFENTCLYLRIVGAGIPLTYDLAYLKELEDKRTQETVNNRCRSQCIAGNENHRHLHGKGEDVKKSVAPVGYDIHWRFVGNANGHDNDD